MPACFQSFSVPLKKNCFLCLVGVGHKDLDQQKNNTTKKDKPAAEPIVVPIVLRMSDFDHKVCALISLYFKCISTFIS